MPIGFRVRDLWTGRRGVLVGYGRCLGTRLVRWDDSGRCTVVRGRRMLALEDRSERPQKAGAVERRPR